MAMIEAGPVKVPASRSLAGEVAGALRGEILSGNFTPGVKLTIEDLRDRYGVSLSVIREALSRLTADGLVLAQDQRGFRVAPVSIDDLRDLTRTRVFIETEALRDAIVHGDAEWEAGILAAFHRLSRASGARDDMASEWTTRHGEFHGAILQACTSTWLIRFRDILYERSERYRRLSIRSAETQQRDVDGEHRELMRAAVAHDTKAAVAALRTHLEETARIIIDAQREHSGESGVFVVRTNRPSQAAQAASKPRARPASTT